MTQMQMQQQIQAACLPTAADVAFYRDHGYWIAPKLFSDEELQAIIERQDRVYAGQYETGVEPWHGGWKFKPARPLEIRKTDNSHWSDLTIRKAVLNPTIGAIAGKLHDVNVVRLWHDQLLYKPPGGDAVGNVGWHQDYGYWRCCAEPNLLTAWLALVDVTIETGTMMVVPGSHKRGLLSASNFFNQDLDGLKKQIEAESGQSMKPIALEMKAGQLSFHHCLTIHGSGPNNSTYARRSIAIHLLPGRITRNIKGKHMNTELMELKDGEPFEGEYLPIIWQA